MSYEKKNMSFLDEIGFFFHASRQVIKKVTVAAIDGYNSIFAVDSGMRNNFYLDKGVQYTKRGRYYQAISLLESVLEDRPLERDALFHLGFCYLKIDETERGIEMLERAEASGDDSSQLYSILGMAYLQSKEFEKAVSILEKALKLDPKNFNLNYRLGVALDNIKEFDRALASFEKAMEIRPHEPRVYQSMGFVYEQMDRHDDAIVHFKKAAHLEDGKQDI